VINAVNFISDPIAPFSVAFDGTSCEPYGFNPYNREELEPSGPFFLTPPIVSPPPPVPDFDPEIPTMCYEANVVAFTPDEEVGEATDILGEPRFTAFPVAERFEAGWVEFEFGPDTVPSDFPDDAREITGTNLTAGDPSGIATYFGLPVIGFGATTFTNTTLEVDGQAVLSNYGGTFKHRGTRNIEVSN
jgi:hypothetical protein